ncbi:MAG: ramA 2 [Paenibacillus sp.]|jgi:predicted amidohydrolase|nr:ramA 2 [Paenibacillus sp.]
MTKIKIGLAALRHLTTFADNMNKIRDVLLQCQTNGVDIVCFPEGYLPGLRGTEDEFAPPDNALMDETLRILGKWCKECNTALIIGMEYLSELGLHNRAYVISADGLVMGYQTKNQIPLGGESLHYVADGTRAMFEVKGVPFGIAICHEGWRYPETVRWAAVRGAKIVFQPQWTGRKYDGVKPREWGEAFFEKAMICRAQENTIFFASVNVCMDYQTAATSVIDPHGNLLQYVQHGEEQLLIQEIDTAQAEGTYATRYNADLYPL